MKNYIIILAVATVFSCKAQSIIVPMGSGETYENNPNYYLKDVDNDLDKFEGTWKYQNGDSEITFKLKKETHYQTSNDSNFRDLLVGEYEFIENGTVKANTLQSFDNTAISGYLHKISGGVFVHSIANDCLDNSDISEIKIRLTISDPNEEFVEGRLFLRYINDNGTEKLQVCIYDATTLADDVDARIDIPDGYYEFNKID